MVRTTVNGQYADGRTVQFTVEYSMALNEILLSLANKASHAKNGKSSALKGAIKVRVIEKREDNQAA